MSLGERIIYLTSLATFFMSLIVGLFVYIKNKKATVNRMWLLLSISTAIWNLGYAGTIIANNKSAALFFSRYFLYGGAILVPAFYLHFILSFLGIKRVRILFLSYIVALILIFIDFTSPFMIKDMLTKLNFKYYSEPGFAYLPFLAFFTFGVCYALYLMFVHYQDLSAYKRNQSKYIMIASIVGFLGGATNYPLIYNIKIFPFGHPLVFLYPIIITVAIVRYRLMDITVAVTRTGIFVAIYTLILGLPFAVAVWLEGWFIEILGSHWWSAPLGLMAALATVGPFIYIYIDRKAEARLLRQQRRYQDTLKQASVGMTRIRNLRKLLDLITHIVTKTVRISYAAIYLYDADTDRYVLQVSRDKGRASVPFINIDATLVKWILLKREPLIHEEVKRLMQDSNAEIYRLLEKDMRILTASVIIPSFLEDRFMGFIVLGDKLSGQIYTPEDLDVFQILASQAALAIENAQFYEEAKEMQEQIAQAEKMATIGTMADGLSHQINNRFYALSLIAGDTIDTIKMTDTSNCTPEVREMIGQINHALERIQTNVIQGGEVVRGILKYTRKGEESFEALTLDRIIDGTLEMVQYKVKLSEIDIVRDYTKSTPKVKGNLTQLQEVFFNFIDNAYDAIVERGTLLKEEGYHGRIIVSAVPKNSSLEITVEDNGIGVKEPDIKKMFTPFFTTKISSRRGTGLGLYVIKRIITDNHKGAINFESAYRVGTRFIISLPIAE